MVVIILLVVGSEYLLSIFISAVFRNSLISASALTRSPSSRIKCENVLILQCLILNNIAMNIIFVNHIDKMDVNAIFLPRMLWEYSMQICIARVNRGSSFETENSMGIL